MHKTSDSTATILKQLLALQYAVPAIPKAAYNATTESHYATLPAIIEAVHLHARDLGLMILPMVEQDNMSVVIVTRIIHVESGEWIEQSVRFQTTNGTPHEVASAITYGRRISLSLLTNVRLTDDDDGEGAMQGHPRTKHLLGQPTSSVGTLAAQPAVVSAPEPATPPAPIPPEVARPTATQPSITPSPAAPSPPASMSADTALRASCIQLITAHRDRFGKEQTIRVLQRTVQTTMPHLIPTEALQRVMDDLQQDLSRSPDAPAIAA